jgi:hypothetical protein
MTQKTDDSANLKQPKQAVFETIDGNEAAAYGPTGLMR